MVNKNEVILLLFGWLSVGVVNSLVVYNIYLNFKLRVAPKLKFNLLCVPWLYCIGDMNSWYQRTLCVCGLRFELCII